MRKEYATLIAVLVALFGQSVVFAALIPAKPGDASRQWEQQNRDRRVRWLQLKENGGFTGSSPNGPVYGCSTEDEFVLQMAFILYGRGRPQQSCWIIEPGTDVKILECHNENSPFCKFQPTKYGWLPWGRSFWTSTEIVYPH
jgi:hypothetical protein